MKDAVKKEIILDFGKAVAILNAQGKVDGDALKALSNQGIEDVALHKDLDMVSVTVLIYSLHKIADCIEEESRRELIDGLVRAQDALKRNFFGKYNRNVKGLFKIVRGCNARVKEHLADVMDAARIKKGTVLLQKGLSLGQAAGLMGLTNWDLQSYAGKTVVLGAHVEKIHAKMRLKKAFSVFGVSM